MKSNGQRSTGAPAARHLSAADRERMIAEAAYFRALGRNFQGGDALDDWYCAEREIDFMLLSREEKPPASDAKASQASRQSVAFSKAQPRSAK